MFHVSPGEGMDLGFIEPRVVLLSKIDLTRSSRMMEFSRLGSWEEKF